MPTTPDGLFELIDVDYQEVIPPLQEFQRRVEEYLAQRVAYLVTLSAGTLVVALPETQPDTNYEIFLATRANETFWTTSHTTSQFTLNSSNGSSSAQVGWFLLRRAPPVVSFVVASGVDVEVGGDSVTVTI